MVKVPKMTTGFLEHNFYFELEGVLYFEKGIIFGGSVQGLLQIDGLRSGFEFTIFFMVSN